MKTRLTLRTALVACTLALTLLGGLAQAKSVEEAEGEADVVVPKSELSSEFVSEFSLYAGSCNVGPRGGDVIFTCFGFGFPSANPTTVHCQLRNPSFDPTAYPDQFSCQVLSTAPGSVTVRIRRMDDGTGSSGWGQDLRLNLLIVN
jgi:hypothetical protein